MGSTKVSIWRRVSSGGVEGSIVAVTRTGAGENQSSSCMGEGDIGGGWICQCLSVHVK